VRAPTFGQPTQIQRRAETVSRPVFFKHRENVLHGFLVLAQDPIAILAHDGQPMKHHRLTRTDDGPQAAPVERPRQFQVDVHPATFSN
jgi:hypothetical protein